jgi:hypothetical protein
MKNISRILLLIFIFSFSSLRNIYGCNAVTGLNTTSITATSATLNWNATSCDSFLVRYFIMGTNIAYFKIISDSTATSVTIDSLYPNTNYGWLIHTYCNGGQSGPYQTSPAQFITLSGFVSCIPANLLDASDITTTSSHISWNQYITADTFLVRYHVSGSSNFLWKYIDGINNSTDLTGLTPSTIYEWEVRTICNGSLILSNQTDTFVTNCDTLPLPDHIVICIMENKGYPQVIDTPAHSPYIAALANDPMSALFTQSYAIAYPSQPNYINLFSGANQGVTNNNVPSAHFTTPNLARSLLNAGKTFVTYAEDLPFTGCDTIRSGSYERKHNPVTNWMGVDTNQVPDTCNQPFSNFPSDYNLLPTVSFIIPNMIHDMHNAPIDTGDAWLAANMDAYVQWAKTNNSLFILTFDEDNHSYNNHITTIFSGPMVVGGQYPKYMNHHSVLRTIEDMYNISHAGNSGSVESIRECWAPIQTNIELMHDEAINWAVYGYAGAGELNIDYELPTATLVEIRVFNLEGKLIYVLPSAKQHQGIHREIINVSQHITADGLYIVRLQVAEKVFSKKVILNY